MARKTLLIGLGGTGCAVVQQVKEMIGPNTQDIQFLGFDTDHSRAGKFGLDVVETGRNLLVEDLLPNEPDSDEWFPHEPTLYGRNMQNGAGQVRTLSRLALKDTIRRNGMGKLEKALDILHTPGQDNDNVAFFVTIVSSFAGGTGSGMFISLALYLRRYILNTYGTNAIIEGVFALPDVFIEGKTSDVQKESMFANTFASLKELVNINRVCLSKNPSANEIKMRYRVGNNIIFDSAVDRPDENNPPVKLKPFDLMFFFDKINSNRNVLPGGKDEYLRCMAQAVFMRCFAPAVRDSVRSEEDNLSVSQIESDNENRFGALGTAKLIYPYLDILEYCNLRSAMETIGQCWNAPEVNYKRCHQEELAQNKLNKLVRVRSRGEIYIDWVENNISQPEFAFLEGAITQESKQSEASRGNKKNADDKPKFVNKAVEYFNTLEQYINDEAEKEVQVPNKKRLGALESLSRDKIKGTVKNAEEAIRKTFKTIKESFMSASIHRVDTIFPQELTRLIPDSDQLNPVCITGLLRKNDSAVHPLAARYLLYKVRESLDSARNEARAQANTASTEIETYIHKDWLPKTKGVYDDAVKSIPSAVNLLGLQDFARKYSSESEKAINALSSYRLNQLKFLVYNSVLKRLDLLISQYEQLFDLLPSILKDMNTKINLLATKHSSISMEQYLCASPEAMAEIYGSLDKPQENTASSPIYDSLLRALCNYTVKLMDRKSKAAYMHQALDKKNEQYESLLQATRIKKLFENEVLPFYFDLLNKQEGNPAKLDKDILTALDEEAEFRARAALEAESRDYDEPTVEECKQQRMKLIIDLITRAAPHLMYKEVQSKLIQPLYWCVNQQVAVGRDMSDILNNGTADEPTVARNIAFPRHELSVYRSSIGLLVSDVKKFVDYGVQHGEYFENYENRLRKISQGLYRDGEHNEHSVTPHADIRWHLREYLQPLSDERDAEDRHNAARAMWLGIIYRNIRLAKNQRTNQLCVSFASPRNQEIGKQGVLVPLYYRDEPVKNFNQMYQLYHALLDDNLIKHRLLDLLEPVYLEDAHRFMAVGSSGYNMKGANANPLLRALHDEEHADKPQTGLNVLTLAEDILKLQAMDTRSIAMLAMEKDLIIAELMNIINGLQMTTSRKKELCAYIAQCSIYRTNVASRARDEQFLPNFNIMALPTERAAASRRKAAEKAAPAEAPQDAAPKSAAKKTSAAKTSAAKAPAKKTSTAKASTAKAAASKSSAGKSATAKAGSSKKTSGTKTTK